ncbi:MAG: GntR family transcriptional regulator [Actinomycetota bacterium]|nr:GntR family transcriptional regulator [Actinomycetota bacterium]
MPVPRGQDAVDRHLLRDTAYETLCGAIVDGTLAPGEQLHDAELCRWLGLSRTPVREALARLAGEGLIELAPQRYTRVAPLEGGDAHDVFPVLASMQALATELAVPGLTPADVVALNRYNDQYIRALRAGEATRAHEADDRFHRVFVNRCANPDVADVLAHLAPRLRRFERLADRAVPGRRSVAQHHAIVLRASSGQAQAAASAVRENWLTLGLVVERALAA